MSGQGQSLEANVKAPMIQFLIEGAVLSGYVMGRDQSIHKLLNGLLRLGRGAISLFETTEQRFSSIHSVKQILNFCLLSAL
mmetsp:Transcript_25342/g.30035  ORF Transcript_25342/g.30035 Transcript_25342/m.30035 type:complete len:81 (+) Transcript_25342:1197-1439(+)